MLMGECQDPRALGPHLRTSTSLLPHGCNFALRFRLNYSTTTWWTCASVHLCPSIQQISIDQISTSLSTRKNPRPVANLSQSCLTLSSGLLPSATSAGLRTKDPLTWAPVFSACQDLSSWPLFPPSATHSAMSTPSLFL